MKYIHFITLEWKAFTRSASFGNNIVLKIFMGIGVIYMISFMLLLGFGTFYVIKDFLKLDEFSTINQLAIYYFGFDFFFRYFMQKMPVADVKNYLSLGIQKNKIVHYTLFKTIISFFNIWNWFYFIPLGSVLIKEGFNVQGVITWTIAMLIIVYLLNFLRASLKTHFFI